MKKVLIALDCNSTSKNLAVSDCADSILKTAKNLHGNIVVRGSQNRKWLEKYCHGKCYGRSFSSYLNSASRQSNPTKRMNIVVILKQGFSNQLFS